MTRTRALAALAALASVCRETTQCGGSASRLVQAFAGHGKHSNLSDATDTTLVAALLQWLDSGTPPTPAGIAAACLAHAVADAAGCRFWPDDRPAPLAQRVAPRN